MKALRILGIVVGIFFALVAVGVGALYALFDGEKIKAEASRAVLEKTQRKLDIAGKVELSVWPDVGISVGRVSLSEPGGKEQFLALESARVAVAVMPLLSKQVQVQRVELNGLKATLVKHKDGTLSIADLTGGKSEKPSGAGAADAAATPMQFDIAGIKVANAQFTWRDEKSGSTTALSNLDLATGRVRADSGKHTLEADAVSLAAKGKSGADAFELKLDAPRLLVSPAKSGGESLNLAATLSGSGRSVTAKLVLSGVEGNAEALKIGKLALDVDAKSGETALKAHLDSPVAVNVAAQTVALEKIAGSIDLANPQMPMKQIKLPLAGKLGADLAKHTAALELATQFDESKIATRVRVARFAPLALGFELDIDQLNVDKYLPPKGKDEKVAKEDKLDFSALKGLDIDGVIRIGMLQVAKLKLAKLNAKLNIANGRLDVAPLSVNLYEGSANGSLSLSANGNHLALKQTLAGVSINPLMKDLADKDLLEGRGNVALDVTSHGDSVAGMKKALGGTASLSLKDGAIKGINLAQSLRDLKGKLGAKQDSTQQAKAGDKTDFSELTASLKIANGVAHNEDLAMKSPFLRLAGAGDIDANGRLDVAPLSVNLYEGSANGSLSLSANGNHLALKQTLAGVSINPLMKDLADKDLLEGRGNVALDVTSHGDSVAGMKKALGGTASLSLKDGAIKGINLAQSLRDLKGKLGAKQDSTQQAKAGDKTDFSELTASLKIANGVAHNEDLAMKSPFLRLAGAGDIDIGGGQMNYLAKASVVANAAGQGGAGLDQLKGLTVPVRVTGPFESLSYKIEFGSLVADAAKAKVEEKKQEVKAKVEEKAKDKLKGLFGK